MAGYDTYVSPVNRAMALGQSIEGQRTARQNREQSAEMHPINKRIATLQGDRLEGDMDRFKQDSNMRSMLDAAMQYTQIQDPAQRESFLDRRIATGQAEGRDMQDTIAFKNSPPEERQAQVAALMQFGQAQGLVPTPQQPKQVNLQKAEGVDAQGNPVMGAFDPASGQYINPQTQQPFAPGEFNPAPKTGQTINNIIPNSETGRIPEGYEQITDPKTGSRSMRPISGSPAENEMIKAEQKKAGKERTAQIYNKVVLEDIGRAISLVEDSPIFTTGLVGGQFLSNLGGTEANDLRAMLTTIKANVGFDRLQVMRESSPTGGALGPVSDTENELLQATLGSVLQSQSADALVYNLKRMNEVYLDVIHGPGKGRGTASQGQTQPTPTVQTQSFQDGQTATNPSTGEKIVFQNGQWQPIQ